MLDKSAVIIVTTLPIAAVLQLLALHHMELISEDACCHRLLVFRTVIEQDFVCGNICSDSAPKTLNMCVCFFLVFFFFFFLLHQHVPAILDSKTMNMAVYLCL